MRFLLDVNVLLALSLPNHQHHRTAMDWFDRGQQWATTPITEAGYIRLLINPRVAGYEIAPAQAISALATMRQLAGHAFVPDNSSLAETMINVGSLAGSAQVTDYHLINLAAINGLVFGTFDGSLSRAISTTDRKHIHFLGDQS
jgi:toxin-antitoxin system PIN domain toxin